MNGQEQLLTTANVIKGTAVLIGLLILGIVIESISGGRATFDLELKAEDYTGIFSHLALVALITERFVEIFTSVIRKPDRVMFEHEVETTTGWVQGQPGS